MIDKDSHMEMFEVVVINLWTIKSTGHIIWIGQTNAYIIFVGKPLGKWSLKRPGGEGVLMNFTVNRL
jgi:hypothetical protein